MANDIESVEDAKKRIKILFGDIPYIDEYAQIAHYLSTDEPIQQLALVSADVWQDYNDPGQIGDLDATNRFTSALMACGRRLGFRSDLHYVYGAALSEKAFMDNVALGVLWKDSFAPEHGEFSHTFQWLAIAKRFGWGPLTSTLYKNTTAKAIFKIKTRVGDTVEGVYQPLWSWLVDCFPDGRYSATVRATDIAHEFSSTFRCPNTVNTTVLSHPEWFLGTYVQHRKDKLEGRVGKLRQELAQLAQLGAQDPRRTGSKFYNEPYSRALRQKIRRENMVAIQEITVSNHSRTHLGWERPDPELGIFTRDATQRREHGKQQIPATFHARAGTISIGEAWWQRDLRTTVNYPW